MSIPDSSSTITQTRPDAILVPNLRVRVAQPNADELIAALGLQPVRIGTAAECTLSVKDPKVSRVHLEVRLTQKGILVSDLDSKNGTFFGPVQLVEGYLPIGQWLTLGDCRLTVDVAGPPNEVALSPSRRFGGAIGKSLLMSSLFSRLEYAAKFNSPILLIGEPGTGKRTLAEAVHGASPWAAGPWVVLDMEAVPPDALEVEMFGCAPGVRADAPDGRAGALEQSHGGTLYIAEPARIPFPLQQKLAAALSARRCYRIGGAVGIPFEPRLISGTQASLASLVASGALDEALFRWLSVVPVEVPALRERKEDIAPLVEHFLAARTPPLIIADLPADAIELFEAHSWPRNVDQLRRFVERLALSPEISRDVLVSILNAVPKASEDASIRPFLGMTLKEARNMVTERFERLYLTAQLEAHGGNRTKAAPRVGIERESLQRLLKRYGIPRGED